MLKKIVKGREVKISSREVKKVIMKANNWTSEEYKKKYDIFKNKLRAFEAYEGVKTKQSPVELLYKQAKAKLREGANYEPTIQMKRIQSFTSISSGKALTKAMTSETYKIRRTQTYEDATYKAFKGLIESNLQANAIYNYIEDPVKREQALKDFAESLHLKIKESGEVDENSAIPISSEVVGSDVPFTFDISKYVD